MLQKDLLHLSKNHNPSSKIVYGNVEDLHTSKFSSNYLCMIIFRAAFEPISTSEMVAFSNSVS